MFVGPITHLKWEEFKNDCGYQAYMNNPVAAI
jgi:hypothetical protein